MITIKLPEENYKLKDIKDGEGILLSGTIYTARDEAHLNLIELMEKNQKLPINLKDIALYYAGPCPTPKGKVANSCGPTTSARMDKLTLPMLQAGVKVFIGKGARDIDVLKQIKDYGAVYLCAVGGAGAMYGKAIKSCECVAFPELGCEAIYKFEIENFPVIKYIDNKL